MTFSLFKDGLITQNLRHNFQVIIFAGRTLLDLPDGSRFVTVEEMWLVSFGLGIIVM